MEESDTAGWKSVRRRCASVRARTSIFLHVAVTCSSLFFIPVRSRRSSSSLPPSLHCLPESESGLWQLASLSTMHAIRPRVCGSLARGGAPVPGEMQIRKKRAAAEGPAAMMGAQGRILLLLFVSVAAPQSRIVLLLPGSNQRSFEASLESIPPGRAHLRRAA
jgi:hypothetical protein